MMWQAPALCGFAESAGFVRADVPTAVAVALAASGGNDAYVAEPWGGSRTVSVGLWQIVCDRWDTDRLTLLLDPYSNARAALALFEDAGARWGWCDGYRSGRWSLFVDQAERAASSGVRADTVALFASREP